MGSEEMAKNLMAAMQKQCLYIRQYKTRYSYNRFTSYDKITKWIDRVTSNNIKKFRKNISSLLYVVYIQSAKKDPNLRTAQFKFGKHFRCNWCRSLFIHLIQHMSKGVQSGHVEVIYSGSMSNNLFLG